MTRDELQRLLSDSVDDVERARLAKELRDLDDTTAGTLADGWAPPAGPDVFAAAIEEAHPRRRWWRVALPVLATVAALVLVMRATPPAGAPDGVKGDGATPALGLVLVVLDAPAHRLALGEVLRPGARLGARVTLDREAWVALEEQRDGAWRRLWPLAPAGALLPAGEQELRDGGDAVVLRVEPGGREWPLRVVSAFQPLDREGARATTELPLEVAP